MLAEWLAAWEYQPGWTFSLHEHPEGPLLRIEFTVPDSRNPGLMQDQGVWTFVPPCQTPEEFYRWLVWRLTRIAVHEVYEFARVRGELYLDPHLPLEEQIYA